MVEGDRLLPWLAGGALIVSAALAMVLTRGDAASGAPEAPAIAPAATLSTAPAAAAWVAPASASPAPGPTPSAPVAPPPVAAPAAVSPAPRPELPPGQVFECTLNGQRIFSDAPCGAHSSIRQLGQLNVMDSPGAPPPVPFNARPYPSPYPSPYPYPYAPPAMDQDAPDDSDGAYSGPQVVVLRERARRNHSQRRDNRAHASPRKN